jgi:hypothetical protein
VIAAQRPTSRRRSASSRVGSASIAVTLTYRAARAKPNAVFSRSVVRALELGHVDLPHLQHRAHDRLRLRGIRMATSSVSSVGTTCHESP